MRVVTDLRELGKLASATVLTIGNFDGVHLGHQKLLRRVVEAARATGAIPAAVTFDPPPRKLLTPERAPKLLTPIDQKCRLVEEQGIELLVILPFTVSGRIVPGSGVGRKKTVPTLNLAPADQQVPKVGVYVTRTMLDGIAYESVTNVGHKPTFGEHPLTVESYLLNFAGELHPARMEVHFYRRLRDERKFPSAEVLKAQIQKDVQRSLNFFRLLKLFQERQTQRTVS